MNLPAGRLVVSTAVALLLGALAPAAACASPQDLFGYGPRTQALGMTGTSYAEGYESIFANPAGLAPARRRSLVVGFTGGGYRLELDGEASPLAPPRGMVIGFALPLPFGDVLEDRLTFGGAFYTPAEVLLRGTVRFPTVPQWTVLDRAQVLAIMVGLGVDLHGLLDGLHLGIGVSALANIFGDLDVRLDETHRFSSSVETQLLTSFAPIVGARYVRPAWGVGLTYRHENVSEMHLEIRTRDLPVELPVLTVGGTVQYDPPTLAAEAYWRPIPDLMVALNLTTRFWSAFPGAQIPTTAMGRNAPDPGFSITPSPRLGVEGRWADGHHTLAIRGGYAFEPTPAPPARIGLRRTASGDPDPMSPVPFRILDNDRHVLSVGVGWSAHLDGPEGSRLVVDLFGQVHLLQPRTHEIGAAEGAAPMRTAGAIFMGGWTAGLEF